MAKRSKRKRRRSRQPRRIAPAKGTPQEAELTAELRRLAEPHRHDPAGVLSANQPNPPVVVRHQVKRLFGVKD